jgi:hypothetical protein
MTDRFVCRFAVGQDNLAYSGIWRVWTARKQPDLYLAVEIISGALKATVHCPRPPHLGWERHVSIPTEASGPVAVAAKTDGGRHKVRWTGCVLAPDCTLEYRVIIRGKSLEKKGTVARDTTLLPVPTEQEYVEVAVLLGPTAPTKGYPRESQRETHLLSEGRLSDGRRVWVVYCTKPIETNNERSPQQQLITPAKHYVDPTADFSKASALRATAFGPQSDGSLAFLDMRAEITGPNDSCVVRSAT